MLEEDVRAVSARLLEGERRLAELPPRPDRDEAELLTAGALVAELSEERERFLRAHADDLYDELTAGRSEFVRLAELLGRAAERVPGLTPDAAALAVDTARPLAAQDGAEIAQGLVLSAFLAAPQAGRHLVHAMMLPRADSLARLDEFRAAGELDLGTVHVRREGRIGHLELRNARFLNAEDDTTTDPLEIGTDLLLLDPGVQIAVLRGGVVDHPRYAGRRIFGSGINLTRIYRGELRFRFYIDRELGFVNKVYRGLGRPDRWPDDPGGTAEKLWVGAVETYAIGGGCQLLAVLDHVIAERSCRMYLPARKEGIIPGASNLRLARSVGSRIARQAILSGREFVASEPDGALLCDEVVDDGAMDSALSACTERLLDSGLINAAANRRALRIGEEPLDLFRVYMATYAREQALCQFSPALVANLERHWNAAERRP